ncbi:alpha/beta fold hydrolase [Candidatus Falkowbacteria bacterium]|nr:alpha/beta fold hydrolase [Candidatus Falkowbacteria bacterium]
MKQTIKNRKGQNLVVLVEQTQSQKGLAFVMHGLGGFKEQVHIQTIAESFKENSYTVVRFDTTNTFGESGGKYEDATTTNYYEDLEDVISWSSKQTWYQEPFCLIGHSLGGGCTVLYAENYPNKVKALAPISTVVSGKLRFEAHSKKELDEWQKTGWQIRESTSKPGVLKKLPWSHMEDCLEYDLLKKADRLTMPVLLIVGENDKSTPLKHQKILYDKLPSKKELHIIKGAEHTFREKHHLQEIKEIFNNWIKKLD